MDNWGQKPCRDRPANTPSILQQDQGYEKGNGVAHGSSCGEDWVGWFPPPWFPNPPAGLSALVAGGRWVPVDLGCLDSREFVHEQLASIPYGSCVGI